MRIVPKIQLEKRHEAKGEPLSLEAQLDAKQKELEFQKKKKEATLSSALKGAEAGSQLAQLYLAKHYFSCGDLKVAKTWLERAASNPKGAAPLTNLIKVILTDDSLSLLNFIHHGSDFTSPNGGIDPQKRSFMHCLHTEATTPTTKNVSLVETQQYSIEAFTNLLKECAASRNSTRGPKGIVFDVSFINKESKITKMPISVLVLKSTFLFDEAMHLRSTRPAPKAATTTGTATYQLCREASNMGHPDALLETAEMLLAGKEVEQDAEAAVSFFRKAAEHKEATISAKYRLGYLLSDSATPDNNPREALKILVEVANTGHFEACLQLGRMYLDANGTDKSLTPKQLQETACEWLEKAIQIAKETAASKDTDKQKDKPTATVSLATFASTHLLLAATYDRLGNTERANKLLEFVASQLNNSYAQLQLAWRYQCGVGVPADPNHARKLLTSAARDKVRPVDNDPAVLIAKALLANDYESLPLDKLATLFQAGSNFMGPIKIGTDNAGRRTIECTMITPDVKEAKDAKDAKDAKTDKDAKEAKEAKDGKDDKDAKDAKEAKDGKDATDTTMSTKEDKDAKTVAGRDANDTTMSIQVDKDSKDDKRDKDAMDVKDDKDAKDEKASEDTTMSIQDGKDSKDDKHTKDAMDLKDDKDAKDEKAVIAPSGGLVVQTSKEPKDTKDVKDIKDSKNDKHQRVTLTLVEAKADDINRYVSEVISLPTAEDPTTQPLGIALNIDLFEREAGFHETAPVALIMPAAEEPEPAPAPMDEKDSKKEQQRIVIMRSGHHTNNWLCTLGDIDKIMPRLLKYLNRDWKRDIAERNSGLEWLPQRLHLSLGKPAFGDVYVGKIGVGCSTWMYVILSTPPPTLRPEIHTVFPVIVAKARKYFLKVNQILEWHNRIEATMIADVEYTTDEECKQAVENIKMAAALAKQAKDSAILADLMDAHFTSQDVRKVIADYAVPTVEEILASSANAESSADPKTEEKGADEKGLFAPVGGTPKTSFPLFAIDFVSRRNIWESKGIREVFLSGIASILVRNPQESLQLPTRNAQQSGLSMDAPTVPGGLDAADDDDDEKKANTRPRSVVPDIAGPQGKTFPWANYKNLRGVIVNEGPRKENRVAYVQGICQRTIQLNGTIWGKSAYMVTIRIDVERKIDLDVWCLLKHMIDGRATIVPGEYMTINAGSVPQPGDLVFADVWIHGTIATGLDPAPTAGTVVTPTHQPDAKDEDGDADAKEQKGGGTGPNGGAGGTGGQGGSDRMNLDEKDDAKGDDKGNGNGSGATEESLSLVVSKTTTSIATVPVVITSASGATSLETVEIELEQAPSSNSTTNAEAIPGTNAKDIISLRLDNPSYEATQSKSTLSQTTATDAIATLPTTAATEVTSERIFESTFQSTPMVSFFGSARKQEQDATSVPENSKVAAEVERIYSKAKAEEIALIEGAIYAPRQ